MPNEAASTLRLAEIQKEFNRQAEPLASAPALQTPDALTRLVQALGAEPAGAVLDLACGPGLVAEQFAPRAARLTGVDATPEMTRRAAERLRAAGQAQAAFALALAEGLPFSGGAFDTVVARLAMHHFPDLPTALAEIRRVLRPGGRLLIADLVCAAEPEAARLHNALEILRDPTHIRFRPPAELLEMLPAAGFAVESTQTWIQPRRFTEWAAIVADPRRTAPVLEVMRALARGGLSAGIDLRLEAGEVCFTHTWALIGARTGAN